MLPSTNIAMTTCPHCQHSPCHKHSRTKAGTQRYKCPACGKVHSDTIAPQGRPMLGDRPLTPAEKMRRHRAKKKNGEGYGEGALGVEFDYWRV